MGANRDTDSVEPGVVVTSPPSFPEVTPNAPLQALPDREWQVVCGDAGHWRCGLYSPPQTSAAGLDRLERHDCPELFLLIRGRITLLLAGQDGPRELPLEQGRPVLVTAPHAGFCPDGPHTGTAFVIERDSFMTVYGPFDGRPSGG